MMIDAAVAVGAEPLRFRALAAEAIRGIGWAQIRGAMLFGVAVTAIRATMYASFLVSMWTIMPVPTMLVGFWLEAQVQALCLLVAIAVANRVVDEGGRRRLTYTLAALGGCVLGVLLSYPVAVAWFTWVLPDNWPADRPWLHGTARYFNVFLHLLANWLLIGGSAVFLYADRRAALQTEARLRAAELDRVRRSKVALESRLQAMQERIEPQFLFNTLAQVERLYEDDPALAGRMLDDLIAYLRAAMPLMRDTSSTVGREIALARAYLDIVRLRLGDRLSVDIEAPPDADDIRMPPMMLLPLIDHAVVRGLEPAAGSGAIRIRGAVHEGRLRLTICDSGVGFAPETDGASIAALRERLDALYGGDARLDLHRADERATEAVLDLPLEPRGAGDALASAPHTGAAP